jgi:hypothetical protein
MRAKALCARTRELPPSHRPPAETRPCPGLIKLPGGNTLTRDRQPVLTAAPPNGLKVMAGSELPEFNHALLTATVATISSHDPDAAALRVAAATAALAAFKPADEIEGMIAAQAVALHHAAMECLRRAALPGHVPEVASKLRKDGANMARAMTDVLDALDRKRGKGHQVVRVERVVVHEGGQAIVGNMKGGAAPATAAPSKPAAIGQDAPGMTLNDIIGKHPELVRGEGDDD